MHEQGQKGEVEVWGNKIEREYTNMGKDQSKEEREIRWKGLANRAIQFYVRGLEFDSRKGFRINGKMCHPLPLFSYNWRRRGSFWDLHHFWGENNLL